MPSSPNPAPPLVDAAAGTPSLRTLGTGANQAAAGNDARFAAMSAAQTTPAASKVPLAYGTGLIDPGWLSDAGAATRGLMGTGAQSFQGLKSFLAGINVSSTAALTNLTVSGTATISGAAIATQTYVTSAVGTLDTDLSADIVAAQAAAEAYADSLVAGLSSDAADITFTPAGVLTSTDVQAAIEELATYTGSALSTLVDDNTAQDVRLTDLETDVGTLEAANTGDVTIGTANGLSLVGQVLSMAAASAANAGAVSMGTQDFNGEKTFNGDVIVAGSGGLVVSGASSGTNAITIPTGSRIVLDAAGYLHYTGGAIATSADFTVAGILAAAGAIVSSVASGSNALRVEAGARIVMDGTTGTHYLSQSGSAIQTSSHFNAVGNVTTSTGIFSHNSTSGVILRGTVANGASAVGVTLDNSTSLTTAGAKIISITNAGSEKAYFTKDGALAVTGVTAGSLTTAVDIPWQTNISSTRSGVGTGTINFDGFKWVMTSNEGLHLGNGHIITAGITSFTSVLVRGGSGSSSTAVGAVLGSQLTWTHAGAKLVSIRNETSLTANERAYFDLDGKLGFQTTNDSATPGDRTINKPHGSVSIDAADDEITVTNSCVAAASCVIVTISGNADATLTRVDARVISGGGGFVIKGNAAATAAVRVNFTVLGA